MKKEQIELLLKIIRIHLNQFYLAMKDRWDSDDYRTDSEYTKQLRDAEKEYIDMYGPLPEWRYHEDVVQAQKDLTAQLKALEDAAEKQGV